MTLIKNRRKPHRPSKRLSALAREWEDRGFGILECEQVREKG